MDRHRRHMDGGWLAARRGDHGDHDHRPAVDPGRVQYSALHLSPIWAASGVSRRIYRLRPYRHRTARDPREHFLARPRRMVAGARASDQRHRFGYYAHWDTL